MSKRTTLHLTPRQVWELQATGDTFLPEAYEADGFIHCTDGDDELLKVANLFYRTDPREFVVLTLDLDRITSEVKYEDPGRIYPHIYGPLNVGAVVDLRDVGRTDDGTFLRFHER